MPWTAPPPGFAIPAPAEAPTQPSYVPLGAGQHLWVRYGSPGQVLLQWQDTWGTPTDWVSVAAAGSPDNAWVHWTYLRGQTAGNFEVPQLQPGAYEARLYYNWSAGGFTVYERQPFSVGGVAPTAALRGRYLGLDAAAFAGGNPIIVRWYNAPGNAQDWVTVVFAGTPDNQWGTWTYLRGQTSGEFAVPNLDRGEYEARIYFNWPAGGFEVMERLRFSIR